MTKKQLKKLAKEMATLESVIQANENPEAVEKAKNDMMKLSESADLELEDMIALDEMISEILRKN